MCLSHSAVISKVWCAFLKKMHPLGMLTLQDSLLNFSVFAQLCTKFALCTLEVVGAFTVPVPRVGSLGAEKLYGLCKVPQLGRATTQPGTRKINLSWRNCNSHQILIRRKCMGDTEMLHRFRLPLTVWHQDNGWDFPPCEFLCIARKQSKCQWSPWWLCSLVA